VIVAGPAGGVDVHPVLVTAVGVDRSCPVDPLVDRDEHLRVGCGAQAVIEEYARGIGGQDRIAAELSRLQHAGERPRTATVVAVGVPGLSEITGDGVELAPADHDVVRIGGIDADRRLVGGVTDDVVALGVDVGLDALVQAAHYRPARLGRLVFPADRCGRRWYGNFHVAYAGRNLDRDRFVGDSLLIGPTGRLALQCRR